jgi:hypothetical protein
MSSRRAKLMMEREIRSLRKKMRVVMTRRKRNE